MSLAQPLPFLTHFQNCSLVFISYVAGLVLVNFSNCFLDYGGVNIIMRESSIGPHIDHDSMDVEILERMCEWVTLPEARIFYRQLFSYFLFPSEHGLS